MAKWILAQVIGHQLSVLSLSLSTFYSNALEKTQHHFVAIESWHGWLTTLHGLFNLVVNHWRRFHNWRDSAGYESVTTNHEMFGIFALLKLMITQGILVYTYKIIFLSLLCKEDQFLCKLYMLRHGPSHSNCKTQHTASLWLYTPGHHIA